jgi:hypothetical protein
VHVHRLQIVRSRRFNLLKIVYSLQNLRLPILILQGGGSTLTWAVTFFPRSEPPIHIHMYPDSTPFELLVV